MNLSHSRSWWQIWVRRIWTHYIRIRMFDVAVHGVLLERWYLILALQSVMLLSLLDWHSQVCLGFRYDLFYLPWSISRVSFYLDWLPRHRLHCLHLILELHICITRTDLDGHLPVSYHRRAAKLMTHIIIRWRKQLWPHLWMIRWCVLPLKHILLVKHLI